MTHAHDTNAKVWKSDEHVGRWAIEQQSREAKRVQHRHVITELLGRTADDEFTVLDLGAGTGAGSRPVLARFPRATAVLADFSPQMLARAEADLAEFGERVRIVHYDMTTSDWPAELDGPFDAVITSMCVHHLPDERKQTLMAEIRERLVPGGWYVNYDPVTVDDPVITETWERITDVRDPDIAARRVSRTEEEQVRYENHVRYMIPLPALLGYLEGAGFEGVDAYFRDMDDVICAGRRPH